MCPLVNMIRCLVYGQLQQFKCGVSLNKSKPLTLWDFDKSQWKIRVIEIGLLRGLRSVVDTWKQAWSIPWSRYLAR